MDFIKLVKSRFFYVPLQGDYKMNCMRNLWTLSLFFCLFHCSNFKADKQAIAKEIASLSSIEIQKSYLERIHNADQKTRRNNSETLHYYGMDSEEYKQSVQEMIQSDVNNLERIEQYLKKYGHPSLSKHGTKATNTPKLIIHHAVGGIPPRARNFKYLYEATKTKDLELGGLSFYLNRWYELKFGERIFWEGSYTVEMEMDTLFKALELTEIVENIDQKYHSKD